MHSLARPLSALLLLAGATGFCFGYGQAHGQTRRPTPAPIPAAVPPRPANTTACNYQDPQDFMIRSNWATTREMPEAERRERRQMAQRSVNFRTEQYGYFTGFGSRPLPREGQQTGRAAFFDLSQDGAWGGIVSGDRITVDYAPCPCGRPTRPLAKKIQRVSEVTREDDKLTCAATPAAQAEALGYLNSL